MATMLFAKRVKSGKTEFDMVPPKLKQTVADILVKKKMNRSELVPVEYGGTKA